MAIIHNDQRKKEYKPVATEYYLSGSDEDIKLFGGLFHLNLKNPKRVTNRKELPIESRIRHVVIYVLPNTPIELKIAIQTRRGIEVIYL